MKKVALRALPKIDEVLQEQRLAVFFENTRREVILAGVREVLEELRSEILAMDDSSADSRVDLPSCFRWENSARGVGAGSNSGSNPGAKSGASPSAGTENSPVGQVTETVQVLQGSDIGADSKPTLSMEALLDRIIERLSEKRKRSLKRVINATGIVLHTNLGRAPLSEEACKNLAEIAGRSSTLEYDDKKGTRGDRHSHVEGLLTKLTGTEAAMVVNNNAAATMLCLSALGAGKEFIVSRGELVEIGGSFRIPDIMEQSGATLREIGTTNKTRLSDYEKAIGDNTAALLKIHTSNYRILGFTEEASLTELVALGEKTGLPVIYDMGSGLMVDLSSYGIDEPTVVESLRTGIDLILFSGDKLLGGPQAGILVGRKEYIEKMKKHPLARVVRMDKLTLAALEATLEAYGDSERALREIPVLRMLTEPVALIEERALVMEAALKGKLSNIDLEVVKTYGQVGGGSAPLSKVDGIALALSSPVVSLERLERLLRKQDIPVISRITKERLHIELRALGEKEEAIVVETLIKIDGELKNA